MLSLHRGFFLFVCLVPFAFANFSWGDPPARQTAPDDPNKPMLLDQQGDPLPSGAVARMGTLRFRATGGYITSLAFSPDGKSLASVGVDRNNEPLVQLWDTATGKRRLQIKSRPGGGYTSNIVFSPDGKFLGVSGYANHHLWDSETGKEIVRFESIPKAIHSLVFSPDGTTLATIGYEEGAAVQLWDFTTGKALRKFQWHHGGGNNDRKNDPDDVDRAAKSVINLLFGDDRFKEQFALYSPDGKTVSAWGFKRATGEWRVRTWETHTGKQVRQVTDVPAMDRASRPSTLGCSFLAWDFNTIRVLDGSSAKELGQVGRPNPVPTRVFSAEISPDSKTLVSNNYDGSTHLLDIATGKELRGLGHNLHAAFAFSADGKSLAFADNARNVIHLVDPATGKDRASLEGHNGSLDAMFLAADGKTLATASQDKTVRFWDTATGKEVRQFALELKTDKHLRFAFSRDGTMLAAGAADLVRSWELASGKALHEFTTEQGDVTYLAFSPNGRLLAAAMQDGSAHLWNTASGKEKCHFQPVKQENVEDEVTYELSSPPIRALAFSPNGKTLAMMTSFSIQSSLKADVPIRYSTLQQLSNGVRILEVATGKERRLLNNGAAIRPAGIRYRNVGGRSVQDFEFEPSDPEPLLFSPDGKSLAFIRPGTTPIRLNMIDAATGETMLNVADSNFKVDGPDREVVRRNPRRYRQVSWGAPDTFSAVFSADGRHLAAGSGDGIVRVWETTTGKLVCRFIGHQGDITALAFSADGRMLFSGSDDTTALAWDIARGMKEMPPSKEEMPPKKTTSKAAVTALSPEKLESFWADLAQEDPVKAGIAMLALERSPKESVPFVKKLLQPTVIVAEPRQIERLIADLDHEQPMARDKAMSELEKLERMAEPALRKTLETNPPSLEARRRVERLLEKLDSTYGSLDALRSTRALEVLERVGSPEARGILEDLSKGTPEAERTRDARDALARWNQGLATKP